MGGAAALAASMAFEQDAQCASTAQNSTDRAEGGYRENPIQHVAALLRLYDEIDRNMDVLTNRMLQDLQRRVEEEKKANDGKLKLSPEQIALSMSIEFESTLEKVQDAVFRNNYVTKEEVQDALQRMVRGELRGSGRKGEITIQEAEAIEGFVKQLGRMRWKVTGSREPLLPTQSKPLVKQEKPKIPLETVTQVMEKLIPSLTTEMEKIVRDVRTKESKLSKAQQHQLISKAYIKRSGELTEKLCAERKLDMREFQAALIYYHDDPVFEESLARLSAEQQRKFAEWGL
ncbi:hypothetical protein Poli38472_004680 [Pythium oligandrum]|uniref:Uncharacterized protein n=1 Tax=Pythium oligandrum TaxID=41045 RepID=A0A8K1FEN3_PYTOL|nr:hypothetical protein Poli38472_004680 [Pythium oligandrum]|eukprot:TMW59611.1 hypothetical protein Poli38472_004680 [Pythium oligandrum]